jgi:catechol 2,3-dioxygenase-like lactoylglutathione lyase family enzyme
MRIGLTGIFVDDQDQAERFSTRSSASRSRPARPTARGALAERGVARGGRGSGAGVLHLADAPARAFQAVSRQVGRPMLSLATDDCQGEAERLKAKGVVFVTEPYRWDHGGIDAVFADSCGNLPNLHQD